MGWVGTARVPRCDSGILSSQSTRRYWGGLSLHVFKVRSAMFVVLKQTSCFSLLFSQTSPWVLWSVHLSTGPVSHEQKLSQSLEIALTSTLGSMPSFTARLTRGQLQHLGTRASGTSWRPGTGSEQPGSVLGPECASCKRVFSPYFKKEPVYQLPCGHLLCRPCLGEKQRSLPMTCAACQQPVASQDVLRVHF